MNNGWIAISGCLSKNGEVIAADEELTGSLVVEVEVEVEVEVGFLIGD